MRRQFISLSLMLALSTWMAQAVIVKGTVSDTTGKPVRNVVVTDGFLFTQTDNQGHYTLDTDTDKSRFVYISVPSGYKIDHTGSIPDKFYQEISNKEGDKKDFVLIPRKHIAKDFIYLAISDPQPINEKQLARYRNETVPDLRKTIEQTKGKEVYGVALGDISWDRMDLFTPYKEAISELNIPMFSVIGNHDHDQRFPARSNPKRQGSDYAERIFENQFGPYNYSVNIGDVHIITLKDIDYYGGKKYDERFGKEQLDWLKKDLSYVKPGSLVFINVHAPVFNTTDKGEGNAEDAEAFREIVSPYNVHIFAGHTHYFENNPVTPHLYEHNIGAACGAWWAGHANRCGAPNGYLVVHVKGDKISWRYKATGRDKDYQFRVYRPGEFKSETDYIIANVWDWDPAFKVEWSEDGVSKGNMERFSDEDQDYITMHGKPAGYHTLHLFRCRPTEGTKEVEIKVTNRFGETFTQKLTDL